MLVCLAGFLVLVSSGCCPKNPQLNTVITAHGNTDWHIDTAEEFLFGTDMDGDPTAANHCPNTWTRRHIHVGLTNTNHYYYDSDLTTPGDDSDATNGIDKAMLFFYAGHGAPTLWNTLGNNATQSNMKLGDCPGGGLLRYYWQCSCAVFAHGPRNCPGATFHYACPGDFDGSPDSVNMRNVYERWGPVLSPDLRMAGGASTSAYCHEMQTDKIWDNYNNKSYDVADSFIDGLNFWNVVPLCITMGGVDVTATPLYDATFTNQPNTSGTSHYHIQYLTSFATTPRKMMLPESSVPESLPVIELEAMEKPKSALAMKFKTRGDFMVSTDEVADRGARIRINRLSGAIYVRGNRHLSTKGPVLSEKQYIEHARAFIKKQGWEEQHISEPTGIRLMLESMPVGGKPNEKKGSQKNVIVTFKRQIKLDDMLANVLGEGGIISVQMNNDGSVFNASKVWRKIKSPEKQRDRAKPVKVKTFEEAKKEALKQILDPKKYKLDHWMWGYKEAAGNVKQTRLKIVYQFAFVPIDPDKTKDYPPMMIEIPGQQ
jgi:hypothetical protein